MRIPSKDIPQADDLNEVVRAVAAVNSGARTDRDIGEAIGKVPRQGRYYRRAGEILNLITNVRGRNRAILTHTGRRFVEASAPARSKILAEAVLGSRVMERVIPYLESRGLQGASRNELEKFIESVTELGPSMIERRVSTIVSWLEAIGLLRLLDGRYHLVRLPPNVPILEYEDVDEPLFPEQHDLKTYKKVAERAQEASGYLPVLIDEAARDRANAAHRMLTNLVADRIRAAGSIPKMNKYIDLSTVWADNLYIFEMKSTRAANVHDQIRKAVSQLYEYRYLQETPSAKLVVVVENPLPNSKKWLIDYVVKDRKLLIAWDGDRRSISFPAELGRELNFLS